MKFILIGTLFHLLTLQSPAMAQPQKILTSFSVIQSMAKAISSDDFLVETLVPNCSDIHDFQVRPKDMIALKSAQLFISHGNGIDSWAKNLKAQGRHLELSKDMGLPDHSHSWLQPNVLNRYLELITQELIKLRPDREKVYLSRLEEVKIEVTKVYEKYRAQTKPLAPHKVLITSHEYLSPLQSDFSLNIISLTKGSDHDSLGPKDLVKIHSQMTANTTKVLLLDQASPALPVSFRKYKLNPSARLHIECLRPDSQILTDYYESNLSLIASALK